MNNEVFAYFQAKELDTFFAALDGSVFEKKTRRESSSLVDEFFQDDKNAPELLTAKQRVNLLYNANRDLTSLKASLLQGKGHERRESSSLVDEFFRQPVKRAKYSHENSDKSENSYFDITATMMGTNGFQSFHSTPEQCLPEQSKKNVDSLWEDIRDSIDIETYPESDGGSSCDLNRVKIEQPDPSYKSSCQFQNSRSGSFENVTIKTEPVSSSCAMDTSSSSTVTSRPNSLGVSRNIVLNQPFVSQTGFNKNLNSPASYVQTPTPPHCVPVFLPPTPPNSQPGSPSQDQQVRRTPPPPYPGFVAQSRPSMGMPLAFTPIPLPDSPSSSTERPRKIQQTHPGCSTIKYNRKNNPELEKRRIHFCDFPGK